MLKSVALRKLFIFYLFGIHAFTYCQIVDDFSDGNFKNDLEWKGDTAAFVVNTNKQLQLNNNVAGTSYLSTTNLLSSLDEIEWRFYIHQNFSSSASNYSRVYLVSDQENLQGSLNGYYLQFGEAGSNDAIELFKQTGLSSISVLRGESGKIAAAFEKKIKVTRSNLGLWSLYTDSVTGATYTLEAEGSENSFNNSSHFGLKCVYTLSNASKFYFDDFYVGPIVIDTEPPSVLSIDVVSAFELKVKFTEAVEQTSAQNVEHYIVNNNIGKPSEARRDSVDISQVHLIFSTTFSDQTQNTLTINGIGDLRNNIVPHTSANFTYYEPVVASFSDILINEIFADPSPPIALPFAEYIELYNRSSKIIDLKDWKIADAASSAAITSYSLTPGSYVVLCDKASQLLFSSSLPILGISNFPSLNNGGDQIYLKDSKNNFIDSVNYSDSWYGDDDKKNGGWAIELINPNVPAKCSTIINWNASTDSSGGTPGFLNSVNSPIGDTIKPNFISVSVIDSMHLRLCFSELIDSLLLVDTTNYFINGDIYISSVKIDHLYNCINLALSGALQGANNYSISLINLADCSGNNAYPSVRLFSYYIPHQFDVVINEIMVDPDPPVGLPNYEYIELYNRTPYNISLKNWILSVGNTSKIIQDINIWADSFVVFTSNSAMPEFDASVSIVGLSNFPLLTNSSQTILLKDTFGNIISRVSYSDSWYKSEEKISGGWSLEQIDPTNPCSGQNNWEASSHHSGGTPGRKNSVIEKNADQISPEIIRIVVIDSTTIQLYFNESLDSVYLFNTSIYHIDYEVGTPLSIDILYPDYSSIILKLQKALLPKRYYTLTLSGLIRDCAGNELITSSKILALPEKPEVNDVVINEVLFNPRVGGSDFVELYNKSDKVIDLKSISFAFLDTANGSIKSLLAISKNGYLLFPKQYIVLTEDAEGVKNNYYSSNAVLFIEVEKLPEMNNSDGTIVIANDSIIIDKLIYSEGMHFPLLNETKGVSLERIDFNRPTQEKTNWHSAAEGVGFATPGFQNSQYVSSDIREKVKVVPEIFSPDNDGNNDVTTVYYSLEAAGFVGNITIFDSRGRKIRSLIQNELLSVEGAFSWDGINDEHEKAPIGIYVVLVEIFSLQGEVKQFKNTCVLASKL